MAPVSSSSGKRSDSKHRQGTIDRSSGLVARVKYCNQLPDVPFDPKFLRYPFDPNRFVTYQPTSLEKLHKTELHTDPCLGVNIDLINPDTYKVDPNAVMDPDDEQLYLDDAPLPGSNKRSQRHNKNVSWLRRSEYISQEFNRYGAKSSNIETRIGAGVKDLMKEEDLYKDRDGQIAAIEKTFSDAKVEITKHHSKPNVYPTEILPVYPDFKMWMHPSAQVIFDADPSLTGQSASEQMEEKSQAMIRGMVDEEGDQFVAYFLPTAETRRKRKRDIDEGMEYDPEETYDYKLAREYNWNVKNKASKGYEENYFFVFREDGVFYNELETRVRLSKRRAKGGGGVQAATNAVLAVRHRDLNDQEVLAQEHRKQQLENLEEVEDDEEEEEEEGEEGQQNDEEAKEEEEKEVEEGEKTDEDEDGKKEQLENNNSSSSEQELGENSEGGGYDDEDEGDGSPQQQASDAANDSSSSDDDGDKNENEIFGSASDMSDED